MHFTKENLAYHVSICYYTYVSSKSLRKGDLYVRDQCEQNLRTLGREKNHQAKTGRGAWSITANFTSVLPEAWQNAIRNHGWNCRTCL